MESTIFTMLLLQVFLIALNAVFACAEIAVISMNDTKLAKMAAEGDKRAVRLARLTNQPARFLATIQVAITLSGFLGSAFAADHFSGMIVDALLAAGVEMPVSVLDSIAVVLITIVLSYVTLVFGELVPKQMAMRKAESLALGLSGLISGIAKIFSPLVSLLTLSTNAVLRLLGVDPNAANEQVGEEEIRMMVDAGNEKGTIDNEEREFIQNVFEFDDLTARELATHRTDVVMLDMGDSMEEWKDVIFHTRHTRYPICEGSVDKIVGVLNAKEYFRLENQDRETVLEYAVLPPYFVPDTIKADTLFRNMKRDKRAFAVVLDEYGGTTGILTVNDLIGQLVGDVADESGEEEEVLIEYLGEDTWHVHGSARLEDISDEIGVPLYCEEYDTLNGLVFHTLESVPEDGADIEFEVSGLHIKVTEIEKHQVETAVITLLKEEPEEEEEE